MGKHKLHEIKSEKVSVKSSMLSPRMSPKLFVILDSSSLINHPSGSWWFGSGYCCSGSVNDVNSCRADYKRCPETPRWHGILMTSDLSQSFRMLALRDRDNDESRCPGWLTRPMVSSLFWESDVASGSLRMTNSGSDITITIWHRRKIN